MSETKTCFKCKRVLPLSKFYRHVTARDGYHPSCKGCMNSDRKASRWSKRSREIERKPPVIVTFFRIHDVWPAYPPVVGRDKPVLSPAEGAEPFPAQVAGNADAYSGLRRRHSKTKTFGDLLRSFA